MLIGWLYLLLRWFRTVLVALCLSGAVQVPALAAQTEGLVDFDFVTGKVEANYAGWETKTQGAKRAELEQLTQRLREDAGQGGEDNLRRALNQWIAWFNDGHLQLHWYGKEAPSTAPPSTRDGTQFALRRINATTLYLRLASFNEIHTETVRRLIANHAEELGSGLIRATM